MLGLLGLSSGGSTIQTKRCVDVHTLKQLRSWDGVEEGQPYLVNQCGVIRLLK